MTFMIHPIRDLILEYAAPDYRGLYDAVMRDMSWFGGYLALEMYGNNECVSDSEYEHVERDVVPYPWVEKYNQVVCEIGGAGMAQVESRFW